MKIKFDTDFEPPINGIVELSPLIRRITCGNPGPFTFRGTNTFIVGRGQVAVVDPGPDDEAHLAALLNALHGETVEQILVTHTHMDHSPLAAKLKAATGAKTYGAISRIKTMTDSAIRLDASIDRDYVPDVGMRDGDVLEGKGWSLETVFTPGHMASHMCFGLREEKALLSGDHVMAWATTVVAPPDGNMNDYMESLQKLLRRDEVIYHPAHGPASSRPQALVRGILTHRKMREEAIYSRVKAGDRNVAELVKSIYADVDPRLHGAAGQSCLAHLENLIKKGRIEVRNAAFFVRE